jgi:cysteine desulfurase / selenocysteine lyase
MSNATLRAAVTAPPFDVEAVRQDFPVLHQEVHDKPLAYLDSAASAQRPVQVIEAMAEYYRRDHANVHRGVYVLSQRATDAFEGAREKVRRFINAASVREVIFTRGTTEAINLVAQSWGRANVGPGDEIVVTHLEHHANIVPWQMLCEQTGARLRVISMTPSGELDMDSARSVIGPAPGCSPSATSPTRSARSTRWRNWWGSRGRRAHSC